MQEDRKISQELLYELGFKRNGYGVMYYEGIHYLTESLFSYPPYTEVVHSPKYSNHNPVYRNMSLDEVCLLTESELKEYIESKADKWITEKWLLRNEFVKDGKNIYRKKVGKLIFYASFPYKSVCIKEKGKELSLSKQSRFKNYIIRKTSKKVTVKMNTIAFEKLEYLRNNNRYKEDGEQSLTWMASVVQFLDELELDK